jgi:motility quorum-sensing regulator/GCU-specific mRNA interferase toxin
MLPSKRRGTPTYDLQEVQRLVGQGELSRVISNAAAEAADRLGFVRDDVVEAVLSLAPENFYKTMEASRFPGLWQDVYHLRFRGVRVYIKLQIDGLGRGVVIQFKRR